MFGEACWIRNLEPDWICWNRFAYRGTQSSNVGVCRVDTLLTAYSVPSGEWKYTRTWTHLQLLPRTICNTTTRINTSDCKESEPETAWGRVSLCFERLLVGTTGGSLKLPKSPDCGFLGMGSPESGSGGCLGCFHAKQQHFGCLVPITILRILKLKATSRVWLGRYVFKTVLALWHPILSMIDHPSLKRHWCMGKWRLS